MINFLKKYGYLIYFGISILIFSERNIHLLILCFMLAIMFYLVEILAVPDRIDKNFVYKFAWAFVLGFFCATCSPISSINWWIIDIPTLILCVYKIK